MSLDFLKVHCHHLDGVEMFTIPVHEVIQLQTPICSLVVRERLKQLSELTHDPLLVDMLLATDNRKSHANVANDRDK